MNKCFVCSQDDLNKIGFYDIVLIKCDKCEICSLSFDQFQNLIINIANFKNIGNISRNGTVLNGSFDNIIFNKFLEKFNFNFDEKNIKKIDKLCNACCNKLYEAKINKHLTMYFCTECYKIYFFKNDFEKYINDVIKSLRFFYFIKKIIFLYKRFLQIFKRGKNNVKK